MEVKKLKGQTQFLPVIKSLFREAKSEVRIASGLYPGFYNDEGVKEAFERAVDRINSIQIIIDNKRTAERIVEELGWIFDLEEEYPEKLEIKYSDEVPRHFMIFDNSHVRLEEPHKHGEKAGSKNLVVKDAPPSLINAANKLFDELWQESSERMPDETS